MRISDWSSDVCSSDLRDFGAAGRGVKFGTRDGVERPRLHQIEPELGIGPAFVANRREDGAIAFSLTGVEQIGRAHVWTPVTNAHLVCRLLLEKKKTTTTT